MKKSYLIVAHDSQKSPETVYAQYARQSGAAEDMEHRQAEERLVFSGINTATINTGIFDVNNIMIHVAQNFLNFGFSTAMWFLFAWLNITGTSRRSAEGRSLDDNNVLANFSADDFSWLLRRIADTSDIIAGLHDEL